MLWGWVRYGAGGCYRALWGWERYGALWGWEGSYGCCGSLTPPIPPPHNPPLFSDSDPWAAPPLPPAPMAPPLPATPLLATPLPATPPLSLVGAGGGGGEEGEVRLRPSLAFAPAAVARLLEGLGGAQRRAHEVGARLAARGEYWGGELGGGGPKWGWGIAGGMGVL